ncbi:MAG: hypothetical protein JWP75_935, partial [Frondihabitans sp.]|nr:hypothetical protein [Frondihabitans sp.]
MTDATISPDVKQKPTTDTLLDVRDVIVDY